MKSIVFLLIFISAGVWASVALTFTHVGDDGMEGFVDTLELYRNGEFIGDVAIDTAGSAGGVTADCVRGINLFQIRAVDEAGNSSMSNVDTLECCVAGDANGDGACDISDISYTVDFMFNGGPAPVCADGTP